MLPDLEKNQWLQLGLVLEWQALLVMDMLPIMGIKRWFLKKQCNVLPKQSIMYSLEIFIVRYYAIRDTAFLKRGLYSIFFLLN